MNRVFTTVPLHDGIKEMYGIKIGDHIFVTMHDRTGAEILAIKLNRILNESIEAEMLPAPEVA